MRSVCFYIHLHACVCEYTLAHTFVPVSAAQVFSEGMFLCYIRRGRDAAAAAVLSVRFSRLDQ